MSSQAFFASATSSDVAVGGAEFVPVHAPVVGHSQHRGRRPRPGSRRRRANSAVRVVLAAQQATPSTRVEGERAVEIADAQHGEGFAMGVLPVLEGSVFTGEGGRDGAAVAITGNVAAAAQGGTRGAPVRVQALRPPPRNAASGSSRPGARPRGRPRSRSAPARVDQPPVQADAGAVLQLPQRVAALDRLSGGPEH